VIDKNRERESEEVRGSEGLREWKRDISRGSKERGQEKKMLNNTELFKSITIVKLRVKIKKISVSI
jgi:hypothetical protein